MPRPRGNKAITERVPLSTAQQLRGEQPTWACKSRGKGAPACLFRVRGHEPPSSTVYQASGHRGGGGSGYSGWSKNISVEDLQGF